MSHHDLQWKQGDRHCCIWHLYQSLNKILNNDSFKCLTRLGFLLLLFIFSLETFGNSQVVCEGSRKFLLRRNQRLVHDIKWNLYCATVHTFIYLCFVFFPAFWGLRRKAIEALGRQMILKIKRKRRRRKREFI